MYNNDIISESLFRIGVGICSTTSIVHVWHWP